MPTGYTADIAKGITFKQFAMGCAACIMMRDDPQNKPIPERFEPSDYHYKCLNEAEQRLNEIKNFSASQCAAQALVDYEKEVEIKEKGLLEKQYLKFKYESMLSEVSLWNPPSEDHIGLKKFMVEQITESIEFDCSGDYYREMNPKLKDAEEWRSNEIEKCNRNIAYHKKEHLAEVERTNNRNEWIRLLRESF